NEPTLAKREGLDDLRAAKASAGGFLDARAVLAGTPLGYALQRPTPVTSSLPDPFRGLATTPSQGAAPISFTVLSQAVAAGAPPKGGSVVTTLKVPRAAIVDIVAVAMHGPRR